MFVRDGRAPVTAEAAGANVLSEQVGISSHEIEYPASAFGSHILRVELDQTREISRHRENVFPNLASFLLR